MIERSEATRKKYLEKATDKKLKLAAAQRTTYRDDVTYDQGEQVWFRDAKDQERRKGTIIGRDGPNWCIKWNNHLRTVASYDIWKIKEQRTLAEDDEENMDPETDEHQ